MTDPITLDRLKSLGKQIDSEVLFADSMPELYAEMNKYPHEEWTPLRAPAWCGAKLVIMIVRPRKDDE